MPEPTSPAPRFGPPSRGVKAADVERAADSLLRAGERPTIEKIRATLGGGSPNTINPLLDTWWKRLSARLDAGPAALHRLPESVAHVAEALWMQALDEGRRRAQLESQSSTRADEDQRHALAVRSHVLTLREGELDSRLRDREQTVGELRHQLRELTLLLRKEQAVRDAQSRRIAALESQLLSQRQAPTRPRRSTSSAKPKGKPRSKRTPIPQTAGAKRKKKSAAARR
jgi:plasmid replication DNA-binding protein KfrA